MAMFDLPLERLRDYAPEIAVPDDLDAFWAATLDASRGHPLDVQCQPVDTGLTLIDTYDVTFGGFEGHPVKAWLQVPAGQNGPLPGVVEYRGYGHGRGLAHERLTWAAAGYAHLIMDTRGQGTSGTVGHTADPVGSDAA